MQINELKTSPKARRAFIASITRLAALEPIIAAGDRIEVR